MWSVGNVAPGTSLADPSLFIRKKLSTQQAEQRLTILEVAANALNAPLSPRSERELKELDIAFSGDKQELEVKITRQGAQWYIVETPQSANSVPVHQQSTPIPNTAPVPNSNNNRPYASPIAPQEPVIQQINVPVQQQIPAAAFGSEKWTRYFGEVGAEPPLPPNIAEILSGPCPIWPGKTVGETHKLVLVPATLNGAPLTLDMLGELIQRPRQGNATKYRYKYEPVKQEYGKSSCRAHWILMTKDVMPGSRDKSYVEQKAMVTRLVGGYQVPTLLEAAVCILMEHVETGRRLFSDDPYTYTRCQEMIFNYQMFIGGFTAGGPHLYDYSAGNFVNYGIAGLRIF